MSLPQLPIAESSSIDLEWGTESARPCVAAANNDKRCIVPPDNDTESADPPQVLHTFVAQRQPLLQAIIHRLDHRGGSH